MWGLRLFLGILCIIVFRVIKDRVNNGNFNFYVVLVFGIGYLDLFV